MSRLVPIILGSLVLSEVLFLIATSHSWSTVAGAPIMM